MSDFVETDQRRWARIARDRKKRNRLKAIEMLGGKCKRCGIVFEGDDVCAYDFHHKDIITKEEKLTFNGLDWIDEIDKCELLCACCHRIIHNDNRHVIVAKAEATKKANGLRPIREIKYE